MPSSALLEKLIKALQIQPGVGPRSATRIAYHLLDRRRQDAKLLAALLNEAMDEIDYCPSCRDYAQKGQICPICANVKRQMAGLLCVVETPYQVQSIEKSKAYFGQYFVLHGHLSPIDGIGPGELGFDLLEKRLSGGEVKELILALNPTVEGDVTSSYLAAMAKKHGVAVSKIAQGVPIGGDLDHVDEQTLVTSLSQRRPF